MDPLPPMSPAMAERLEKAVAILREEGAREIYIFGSLAKGEERPESDIDLAVSGLAPDKYFHTLVRLLTDLGVSVDLIDLDWHTRFVQFLHDHRSLRRVA